MKPILVLTTLLSLFSLGCTTIYEAQGPRHAVDRHPPAGSTTVGATAEHSLVNNTRYTLNVVQDGRTIFTGLEPGQLLPIQARFMTGSTIVTVSGYAADGRYVGASAWNFLWNSPEVWIISGLYQPN